MRRMPFSIDKQISTKDLNITIIDWQVAGITLVIYIISVSVMELTFRVSGWAYSFVFWAAAWPFCSLRA